jgi:hypothetical protein
VLECILQALFFALVGGPILGLVVGLFSPLVTKSRLRAQWEARRSEHGFWKAWALEIAEMMAGAAALLFFVALLRCCQGKPS